MRLEQLEQLVLIEKHGSLSKAAKELYTTHSTLSNSLSNLEKEIGVRLFERSPSGVSLTEEGKQIVQIAKSMLDEREQIMSFGKKEQELKGEVTVLIAPAYQFLYTDIMLSFQRQFPDAMLHLKIHSPTEIFDLIRKEKVNIGLSILKEEEANQYTDEFKIEHFAKRQTKFFLGKTHPLAGKKSVKVEDFAHERFILFSEHYWTLIQKHVKTDQKPLIIEDAESNKRLICDGKGIGYFSEGLMLSDSRYQEGLIQSIEVPELSNLTTQRIECLIYCKNNKMTLLEHNTLKLLRKMLKTI